jgi:hypothetical protein
MESNIKLNYPVIFLSLWAVLWLPYFTAFLLGNPPIEVFSLYDLVNSNIVVKIAIGSIAVFSELALVAAVIALAVSFIKKRKCNLRVLFGVVAAVGVNAVQLSVMGQIVTT